MTRYLYDALYPTGIPLTIEADAIVASYIDHPEVVPPCMTQLAQRFPNHPNVGISAHGHPAAILDCESGAVLPTAIPALITISRAAGYQVAVYASPNNWSLVTQACALTKVALPLWWAVIRALGPIIPAGAVGNQFLGAGPYDKSIITDEWAAILAPPPPPPPPLELIMQDIVYQVENGVSKGSWWLREASSGNVFAVQNTDDIAALVKAGATQLAGITAGLHQEFLDASHYNVTYSTGRNNAGPDGVSAVATTP